MRIDFTTKKGASGVSKRRENESYRGQGTFRVGGCVGCIGRTLRGRRLKSGVGRWARVFKGHNHKVKFEAGSRELGGGGGYSTKGVGGGTEGIGVTSLP